jgi:hypothetical protein
VNSSKASIRRLRTGVVPDWEIERLSVSYAQIGKTLGARLDTLVADGRCAPLFVRGEWGAGKTHMLAYLRAVAANRGLAHVAVTLNPRSAALNYPQRFYPTLAETVTFAGHRGLRAILFNALGNRATRHAIRAFSETAACGSLSAPLRVIAARFKLSDGLDCGDDSAWNILLGADLAWSDSKRTKALARMAEFSSLLKALGASGLVAVFDEAESVDQLFNRLSRTGAYETLGSLCTQDDVLCVFGITRRFELCIARDLNPDISLFAHVKLAANFLNSWRAGTHSIIEPPRIAASEAARLAALVLETYRDAYPGIECGAEEIDAAVRRWQGNPTRNPRRLVRSVIDTLDAKRSLRRIRRGPVPNGLGAPVDTDPQADATNASRIPSNDASDFPKEDSK